MVTWPATSPVLATASWLEVWPANCSLTRYPTSEPDVISQVPRFDWAAAVALAGAPRLLEELFERALRGIRRCVVVELGAGGDLGALGVVHAVAQDVAAPRVRIVEERHVALAGQLDPPLGLAVVLQLEQAADD